jgi:hypothetical protein
MPRKPLNLPSSRGSRIFAGIVFVIGGSAIVITSLTDFPHDVTKAIVGIPFGTLILIAGIQYLLPRK